jgi:hypothetical protein
LRLSGPTNGTTRFFSLSASASSLLSMLTTITPLAAASASTGTSAFESAGAMTIASTCSTSICCTILIWAAVSVSSLMPLEISVYSDECAFWSALAPSCIVWKNSLASDFMTSATRGLASAARANCGSSARAAAPARA